MKTPMTPVDEAERLQALHETGLLDSPPEERFDRTTRLAKHLFDVPIALVSLIDGERQWFKSCYGLSVTETPRDVSFCGHAILDEEVMVIEDTLEDERFADNPLVTGEPHIRFYAGYPLNLSSGSRIGTLCVIDTQPRQFSEEDIIALTDLGHLIEGELRAERAATVDELTGVLNRRGFLQIAEQGYSFVRRKGLVSVLAYLDLDHFKAINDELGHVSGDQALTDFAGLLRHMFRESDTLARMGGDEFVVYMLDADAVKAAPVLERFTSSLERFNQQAGRDYSLHASIGHVEIKPDSTKTLTEHLLDADTLMYEAKKARQ